MKKWIEANWVWLGLGNTIALLVLLAALVFGVNWMAYEQMRANRGIFVDPTALAAPDPGQHSQTF